jgi:acetaldehyde dehydrogenase
VSSASAGPGTRNNIDEFTRTTSKAVEVLGGAERGKAIIILNPAEPPLMMRDTIFCAIGPDADDEKIATSIHEMVAEVQTYVPGYRLRAEPQFDVTDNGIRRVATFIEVRGAGDFLPPYAGNLDIMTAAAAKVGDEIARHLLLGADAASSPSDPQWTPSRPKPELTCRTPHDLDDPHHRHELRDGSHAKRHQFTEDDVRSIVGALDDAACR